METLYSNTVKHCVKIMFYAHRQNICGSVAYYKVCDKWKYDTIHLSNLNLPIIYSITPTGNHGV